MSKNFSKTNQELQNQSLRLPKSFIIYSSKMSTATATEIPPSPFLGSKRLVPHIVAEWLNAVLKKGVDGIVDEFHTLRDRGRITVCRRRRGRSRSCATDCSRLANRRSCTARPALVARARSSASIGSWAPSIRAMSRWLPQLSTDNSQLLDVPATFKSLRSQRLSAVQNETQYVFIYRVIVDYIVAKYQISTADTILKVCWDGSSNIYDMKSVGENFTRMIRGTALR